jgi:predicted transcriptional regulator
MLTGDTTSGQARVVKGDTDQAKVQALDTLITYMTGKPDASVTELAKVIGRSRATVYNYLDELEQAGRVHRNGQMTVQDSANS